MEDLSAAMILIPLLTLVLGAVFGYIIGTKSKNKPRGKQNDQTEREADDDNDNEYEEEIMNIVNQGHEQGAILEDEAKMITNIFECGDKDVTDVMT